MHCINQFIHVEKNIKKKYVNIINNQSKNLDNSF
jgi:hypothetical protein